MRTIHNNLLPNPYRVRDTWFGPDRHGQGGPCLLSLPSLPNETTTGGTVVESHNCLCSDTALAPVPGAIRENLNQRSRFNVQFST